MAEPGPVAVTGATGFIGRHLALELRRRGVAVSCLARSDGPATDELQAAGARVVRGDLGDEAALAALCGGASAVIHCAAEIAKGDPRRSRATNVEGTLRLMEQTRAASAQVFVHVSTVAVYRATPSDDGVFTEEIEPVLDPRLNPYSFSKLQGEHAVWRFSASQSLACVVVRPTNVYGPGCRPWERNVERFLERTHLSFGNVPFDFVHVADVVDALCAAATEPGARDQTINLGNEMLPLCDFQEQLARRKHIAVVRVPGPVDAVVRRTIDLWGGLRHQLRSGRYTRPAYYPHDKAQRILGYAPRVFLSQQGAAPQPQR